MNPLAYQYPYTPPQAAAPGSAAAYQTPDQQPPRNAFGSGFGPVLQPSGAKTHRDELYVQTIDPADDFSLVSFGVRFGAFSFRNDIGGIAYGTLPTVGLELKRHMGDSLFALSTSMDLASGEGDPILFVDNATGNLEVTAFAWRFTALLEPRPGTWGSEGGRFYFNPYLGLGLGYHTINEQLVVCQAPAKQHRHQGPLEGLVVMPSSALTS